LVEETAPNVTQQLFTLQNNGDIGFGMLNTATGQEWRFRAATADGFRISQGRHTGAGSWLRASWHHPAASGMPIKAPLTQ
jgi:hypothetical protein